VNPRHYDHLGLILATTFAFACTPDEGDGDTGLTLTSLGTSMETTGDGDGDAGDGDGDAGDGDGDAGDGDGDAGDGDGDAGDGDGDGDGGDGDGDTGGGPACDGPVAPDGVFELGQPVSHWAGFTSDGSNWDYCELAGTPFLLVISGAWCGPCNDLAAGMAGLPTNFQVEAVRAGLENGTLGFVEVLLDNFMDVGPASVQDLVAWEGMYPNEHVHLIGDATPGLEPLWIYFDPIHNGAVPAGILVDANFNIEVRSTLEQALATASANYGG
jgi:hypothetical protein